MGTELLNEMQRDLWWSLKDGVKSGRVSLFEALDEQIAAPRRLGDLLGLAALPANEQNHERATTATLEVLVRAELPYSVPVAGITDAERSRLIAAWEVVHGLVGVGGEYRILNGNPPEPLI